MVFDAVLTLFFDVLSFAVMEKFTENTRFCLICNYLTKIIPALQSRCTRFRFGPLDSEQMTTRLEHVIKTEGYVFAPGLELSSIIFQFLTCICIEYLIMVTILVMQYNNTLPDELESLLAEKNSNNFKKSIIIIGFFSVFKFQRMV